MSSNDLYKRLMAKYSGSGESNTQDEPGNEASGQVTGHKKTYQDLMKKYNPVVDENYVNQFFRDTNALFGKYGNDVGYITGRDIYNQNKDALEGLNTRARILDRYFKENADKFENSDQILEAISSATSYLEEYGNYLKGTQDFYGQFETEDEYNWWNEYGTPEKRQEKYESNKKRIEELKKMQRNAIVYAPGNNPHTAGIGPSTMPQYGARNQDPSLTVSEIDKEIAALEKENRMYENGETDAYGNYYGFKVADDYRKYLQDGNFVAAAQNRNYQNATRAEMDAWDASQSDASVVLSNGGYLDDEGNVRNAKGEIVQYATAAPVVQDKLGLFLSASDKDIAEAYNILSASNGNYETTWADIMQEGDTHRWKYLKEDEIQIYYGLLYTEGQEAAYRYLDAMEVELGRREYAAERKYIEAASGWEQVGLNVLSFPMSMLGGIAATVDNVSRIAQGKDLNPYSRAQMPTQVSGYIRANTAAEIEEATGGAALPVLGFSWGDVYQAGMSAVDSLVGAKIGGKAYQAVMSMGAASSTAANLYSQGASTGQIVAGAFAAGAAEWIFEKYSIENLIKMKSPETLGQFLKNAFIQGGIEMSEEAATETANIVANIIIMQSESDWEKALEKHGGDYWKAIGEMAIRVVNAGLGGFVSGAGSGGLQQGAQYGAQRNENAKTGQYISGAKSSDALVALAQEMAQSASGRDQKRLTAQSNRIGKDFITERGKNIATGRLYNTVRSVATEQDAGEISSALQEKGFSPKEANAIANAVVAQYSGAELSDKQQKVLNKFKSNEKVQAVLDEVLSNEESGINQRAKNIAKFEFGAMLNHIISQAERALAEQEKASASDKVDTQKENGSESRSEGGTGYRKASDIVSAKKGNPVVKLDDGSEVSLQDADLSPDDALIIKIVTDIDGISAQDASDIFKILKAVDSDPAASSLGAMEAYRYGYYRFSEKHLADNAYFAKNLTETQRNAIYEIGKKARDTSVPAEEERIKQKRSAAEGTKKEPAKLHITYDQGRGRVHDLQTGSIKGLNLKQKAAVAIAKVLQGLGVGTDFEFFSSYLSKTKKDEEGNRVRVFLDANGNEVVAYAGVYRTGDGKIRIDLNAYNGKGLALNAMSHELVHFIKQWSPEKYRTMAELVSGAYEKTTMSMDQRVLREQNRLKRIRKEDVSYDEAYDEVVANALNRMLDDGTVVDRVAEIRKADRDLADKMIECIRNFAKKLARIFANNESLFYDTYDLMQFKETVDDLRNLFAEALVEASDNRLSSIEAEAVKSLGENASVETNADGEMVLAKNESGNVLMYSEQTYQRGGREKLEAALKQNGHTAEEISETLSWVDDALDYIKVLAAGYAKNMGYTKLANHLLADIVTNVKTGKQVMSAIVSNGDYPVNIDLSLICKKRVAYMNLMSRLIRDGVFDKVNYDGAAIAEVNGILRENGFETACLGCFVESRRLQFQTWAETIVSEWNAEVEKRNPNAKFFGFAKGKMETLSDADINALTAELESVKKNDQGNVNLGQGNSVTRMGRLLDALPSLQMKLTVEDLLTPEGLTALRKHDGSLFSIVKSRYGAASPKIVQDFNPYASEIAMLTFAQVKGITNNAVKGAQAYITEVKREYGKPKKAKGESKAEFNKRKKDHEQRVQDEAMRRYLYDIGGARIQSFSDFMIENIFDYIQIFADLSAKRLPLHGYSKEIVCLRLFGMTGAKWNGSLIAHVERSMGKEYAGLLPAGTSDGIPVRVDGKDYVIGFDDYARNAATGGKSFIQSIGMKDIIALQLDPRYSPYVGNITIGVSDAQIMAMLDNPLFRMVIPYHASGMLPMFAKLVGVDMYNDYTDYQNTTVRQYYDLNGNAVTELKNAKGESVKADTSFAFNAEIQKTGDAKTAADNYLRWCAQRHPVYDGKTLVGYATFNPKFSSSPYGNDFTRHENYYKLLEDFNTYDSVTEESAVQGAVTMNFPSEENRLTPSQMEAYKKALRETGIFTEKEIEKYARKADMTFKEIINAEVGNRANYEVTQAPKWEATVKAVEEKLQQDYAREQYSSQETDFDYSGLNWASDLGIITGKDRAIFERTINNEIYRGAKPQSANGEYIIDTGKCLMFTDGNFHRPTLSRVIEFATEYESLTDDAKRRIIDEAKATGEVHQSIQTIEIIFGQGFVSNHIPPAGYTYAGQKRGRKGSNGSRTYQKARSLKERLADEGLYHLIADSEEQYSTQETDNITARDLLANALESAVRNDIERKRLVEYKAKIDTINSEEQRLREVRAQIKKLSFAKGPRDTKKISELRAEATRIANRISIYDQQLLRLEASKPLQNILNREKAIARQEAEAKGKADLAAYRLEAEVKQSETLRDLRETRAALREQKSDASIMEKEFIRIAKEYEKLNAKTTDKSARDRRTISELRSALREEAKKHRDDRKMWEAEFGRLMREYDAADRNIDRLEQKIERQKAVAKERVESRGRTAVRHKIQNVVDELNRLLLTDSKKHRVPDSLKKAVAEALDLVNMDTVGAEERAAKYEALIAKERAKANPDQDKIDAYTVSMENILRKGEKMGQKLNDLHAAYEKIQNSDDPDIANAYDPVIAGAISELAETIGNTSLKDMTIDQLNDVYDVYKMVLIRVRDANKALAENIAKSIEELAKSTIREVQAVGGAKKYRAAVMDPVRKFDFDNMKPVYAMERIGSDTLIEVFNNVRAGEDTWARDVSEARAYYLDKAKKYGYDKWDFDKKYRFESASGIAFDLTLEQIMSLYAYSRREQAIDHLRLGGFVFDSNIKTVKEKGKLVKYKVNTADAHQITPEIMADIVGKLSKEQIGFVEDMQDYLSAVMGAKGNEVTSKMYGVKLFKEKFYFPLKSAKQFMFEQNEVAGEVKIKNSGFTNKVVAEANNPVVLSNFMDVWAGHVNDMSMYHAFTLPLEDFNRVFNYNTPKKDGVEPVSVKGTIQNAYSPAAVQYIKQLITDLNGGARTDSTTGFINKMMGLFKKGSVFASLSVVVQQPSAIARAAALIDAKYFIGPKLDQKRHNALWEEVKKYAPVALIKEMGYFDTSVGKSTLDYITGREYSGFSEKMKALVTDGNYRDEVLSKAPALADEMAWCSIWEAVKRETKANHPGMDVKSDAFLKLAGERFTEVITKTQVYDSVLARSANMRSKDTGMKMATAFMAEPTTSINMIEDALFKAKRGGAAGKRYCRRAIGAVIASQILNSILVSFVYAARDDDEDETYLEKYLSSLTGNILDGLNPATYIPFIKDIISIVQGYDVERSDMSVVSDLWKAWQNLGKDNVSTYRKVEGFVGSIAQIFGLPVKNIMRDARGIYNAIMTITGADKATGAGIKYAIEEAWTGKSVPDKVQLYEARMAGDTEHAARVEARYDDAESANAAVRAAIKDSFMAGEIDESTALKHMVLYAGMDADEAYWLMDSWKYRKAVGSDDGYGKYSNLYDAVRTGTDLEGVIKTYTDNGIKPSTLTGQITEEFKPEYVKLTPKERSAMRKKLVNAFVLCGMEREDAEEKLDSWDFEAEHGFAYSDRKEAYENGEVSRSELVAILVGRGYSPEDANAQIDSYEWEAEGYEDVTYAAIRNYNAYCAPVGISKAVYVAFWEFEKDTENDVNEATGKPIAYSAVRKIMAYINSLNLTPAQKDALAKSAGWKDSTIKKYKLW